MPFDSTPWPPELPPLPRSEPSAFDYAQAGLIILQGLALAMVAMAWARAR